MADSIRQQIVAAVVTRLKTITTANGYNTEVGASNVSDWLTASASQSDTVTVSVEDADERSEQIVSSVQLHELDVKIAAGIRGGANAPQDARNLLADFHKCIGVDRTWGGLAQDTLPGESRLQAEQADKKIGLVELTVTIKYRTANYNPYTAA